ncbi:glycosyltransferase [Planktomarina temperata]|nr:glycosyltransferase [Planktomarina temperata]
MSKIVIVYNTPYPFMKGGGEKRLYEIARNFIRAGHQVTWICEKAWKSDKKIISHNGIVYASVGQLVRKSHSRRSVLPALFFALNLFRKPSLLKCDLIIVGQTPWVHFFPTLILKNIINRKTPIVLDIWEYWSNYWFQYYKFPVSLIGYLVEYCAIKLADYRVVISDLAESKIKEILKQGQYTLIKNGFDQSILDKKSGSRQKNKLVYFGRLEEHKNIKLLIDSVYDIQQTGVDVRLAIIGAGSEYYNLKKYVSYLKLESIITIDGEAVSSDKAHNLMKRCDVFVQPSISEGGGSIAVLEALACGLPVVLFKHPQGVDLSLIGYGAYGSVVNEVNRCSLSAGILQILQRTNTDMSIRENCIRFAKSQTWDKVTLEYLRFLSNR